MGVLCGASVLRQRLGALGWVARAAPGSKNFVLALADQ